MKTLVVFGVLTTLLFSGCLAFPKQPRLASVLESKTRSGVAGPVEDFERLVSLYQSYVDFAELVCLSAREEMEGVLANVATADALDRLREIFAVGHANVVGLVIDAWMEFNPTEDPQATAVIIDKLWKDLAPILAKYAQSVEDIVFVDAPDAFFAVKGINQMAKEEVNRNVETLMKSVRPFLPNP